METITFGELKERMKLRFEIFKTWIQILWIEIQKVQLRVQIYTIKFLIYYGWYPIKIQHRGRAALFLVSLWIVNLIAGSPLWSSLLLCNIQLIGIWLYIVHQEYDCARKSDIILYWIAFSFSLFMDLLILISYVFI